MDTENLIVSQPDYGEQALEIAQALVTSQAIDVIVIDSVAALTPKAEIEGEMGDSHMGLQARMMSQALRKLTACVSRANTCLVFINQLREKIGVMFGNPETTTGGRALKFYASMRVEVRRTTAIKDGEAVVGNRTKIKIVKNKSGRAVPRSGSRHSLRQRDFARERCAGSGRAAGADREERIVVQLQRRAYRAGARECTADIDRPARLASDH